MNSTLKLASLLVASGLVAACSDAASTSHDDAVGSTRQALSPDTANLTLNAIQYNGIARLLGFSQTTAVLANGNVTVTLPQAMVSTLWPQSPSPAAHAISVAVPTFTINAPDPLGPYTVTVTSFAMTNLATDLLPADAHVHGDFTGNLHFHSPNIFQPDFDIALSEISVDVLIGVAGSAPPSVAASPANGNLKLDGLTVSAQTQVTNCFGGLCNGFIQSQMPNVGQVLHDALQPTLAQTLGGAAAYAGFLEGLRYYAALQQPNLAGWVVAGSPTLGSSQLAFEMTALPNAPSCVSSLGCAAAGAPMVTFTCGSQTDTLTLTQQATNGVYYPVVGTPYNLSGNFGLSAAIDVSQTRTFEVCASTAAGSVCGAPMTVTTPATSWCPSYVGGGGGGGGSFGSGGNGKPCGGRVCLQ